MIRIFGSISVACITLLSAGYLLAEEDQEVGPNAPPAAVDETYTGPRLPNEGTGDAEPVLRGPVHEAFAETVELNPKPGMVIPKKPPEPVQEQPPDLKPSDANVIWIPGYWGWNPELEDFLWVSGTWRKPPQGHRWMPGYWHEVDEGWQWVSGTWVRGESESVNYLDAPPESLERGPVGNAPSTDHFWVPGSWVDQDGRYVWRPGYWSTGYENWVWVPSRYNWTPSGCIYSSGYWDYPLNSRGVLYAPYYSPTGSYAYTGNSYFVPNVVLTSSALLSHLWLCNGYGHYYYGDWYDSYAGFGFFPWYGYHGSHRHRYDPLYVHSRWRYQHRHPRSRRHDYRTQLADNFKHYRLHRHDRPAATFRQQQRRLSNPDFSALNRVGINRINSLPAIRDRDFRDRNGRALTAVDGSTRHRLNRKSGVIRSLSGLRQRNESVRLLAPTGSGTESSGTTKRRDRSRMLKLPRTEFREWVNRNRSVNAGSGLSARRTAGEQNGRARLGLPNRLQSIVPEQRSSSRLGRVPQHNSLQRNDETLRNRIRGRVNSANAGKAAGNTFRTPPQTMNRGLKQPSIQSGAQRHRRADAGAVRGSNSVGSRRQSGGPLSNILNFGSRSRSRAVQVPSNAGRRQPSIGRGARVPSNRNFSSGRTGPATRGFSGRSIGGKIRSGLSGRLGRGGGGNRAGGGRRSGFGRRGR